MRMEVAQNMFNEAAKCKSKMKEESCDDDDEDEKEMKEDFESSVELTEEEFEELQAYMQTEDFEQLDELSKATLKSYVKGAKSDAKAHRADYEYTRNFDKDQAKTSVKKAQQRERGVEMAKNKLAK
jgi:hypothetical protein